MVMVNVDGSSLPVDLKSRAVGLFCLVGHFFCGVVWHLGPMNVGIRSSSNCLNPLQLCHWLGRFVRGCRGFTCRFAASVHKGELVMSCARLAWSALLPLMSQPAERQRARDPVSTLLGCITATTDKKKHKTSEVGLL